MLFQVFQSSMVVLSKQLKGLKFYAISLPFKGAIGGCSITLGIDGGTRSGLLALANTPRNCRLKHCSETLPERQVL